jgi:hypothetical protein
MNPMIANITPLNTYASSNYSQDRKDAIMATVPHVALAAADVYAAASVTVLPPASAFQAATPWIGGVAAIGHAIYAGTQIFADSYNGPTTLQTARGCGHLITAAGFATLAFGLGVYALPIIALGEVTRIVTTSIGKET